MDKNLAGDSTPRPKWRKVAYGGMQIGYNDNYTDETFLGEMVMNANVVRRDLLKVMKDSVSISQYLCIVALVVLVWVHTLESSLDENSLLLLDLSLLALGFLVLLLTEEKMLLLRYIANVSFFTTGLYVLAPVYQTLTRSISSDSIWAVTVSLLLLHLFLHDYSGSTIRAPGALKSPSLTSCISDQDMDAPISHYFIFTGHNSYLTGNQLSSDCSEVPIIDALKKGVRVIELDIWPNSNKNDIDVLHGRTLTSPVELIKCLRAIKTHAFEVSDYPVVVTLEDHLTPELQSKVAEMVTEIFGEILFTPPVGESLKEFPSPNSLKRRIIISTKPPKEYKEGKDEDVVQKGKALGDEEVWGREVPSFIERNKSGDKDDLDDEEDNDEDDDVEKFKKNAPPQYKHLIAIHAGKPKGGITACLKVDPDKVRRLSLSEEQLEKAAEKYAKQIVRFTQQNLLRIYPKGTRVTSSNYNPLVGWSHGAQMVAFNMQGYGRSLWLMQGMFRANGGCGYIKKPDILLKGGSDSDIFDPKVTLPVKTTLRVTIYMGEGWYFDFRHTHFDQYSPPDFYTRVGIAGVPADTVMKKTKTLEDNWVPSWDEVFEFPLTVPELALLRLEVHEYDMSEKDDFGGQTCLPVWELQEGIRSFPLHSRKGEKYKSVKLLVRCEFV